MDGEKRCQQIPHRETGLPHHVRCLSLFFSRGEPSNHWLPDPCVAHMIDIRSWTLISWVFLQPPPKVAPAMIDATSGQPQGTNLPTFFGWFKSKIGWFNPRKTIGFLWKPAYNEFANYPFPRSHATPRPWFLTCGFIPYIYHGFWGCVSFVFLKGKKCFFYTDSYTHYSKKGKMNLPNT